MVIGCCRIRTVSHALLRLRVALVRATGASYANGVLFMISFVETPTFTRSVIRHLGEDEYRALQLARYSIRTKAG